MTSEPVEEGVEASDQTSSGGRCPGFPGPGIAHSDGGTGERALQVSPSCWEAIIVEMLLKYGANYIFKQQSKPVFPLSSFGTTQNKQLSF